MRQVIIYPQDNGVVAIVVPAPDYLKDHTIEDVAAKDVPEGKPYKIIDESEIPADWEFRDAWEYVA